MDRADRPLLGRGRCAAYAHDWEEAERELEALAAVPRFMHYTDAGPEITEGRLLLDHVRLRLQLRSQLRIDAAKGDVQLAGPARRLKEGRRAAATTETTRRLS